ncbi:MAG: TIGR00725 family protein [Actinobacteria bacterium]|nr:TIGR00725 family protein [Actinomycetota bacterium]
MAAAPYVAVVGAGGTVAAELLALAEAVGGELARRGAVVVTGGLGGVMEAVCRGARAAGGTTLGILPGTDRAEANAFVDVAVTTGMGELRNGLVVRCADALVAVGGEYGTLSEIALALKAGKPVAGLGTWQIDGVRAAADPREAVAHVLGLGS